ncbi:ClpXP protease specificity-enhancing factor [Sulfuricella denitrificans skB26]|uniref:ClpXP protease specificity-enhancing factor n=1 Tax=Sulfuricella denitrificans (strain DSM 22764 / NBRC 105220 / skB26) TaxID=1163617 RepID=S6B180_SULDS|nr:ClpXP protease specificity-enhancing factor [Sulfuricella denitrificans]BAN34452.1 ClpXP protease specificity-enhancing factor [Sulfuricella denitrificans skB26]
MSELSTKPYLIRAIYEWCTDSGFTPHLVVVVGKHTRVPMEFAKDGQIVLNVSKGATRNLLIGNDVIQFSARFNGASRDIEVPIDAVVSIYARENAQGLSFAVEEGVGVRGAEDEMPSDSDESSPSPDEEPPSPRGKPKLKLVK